MDEPTSVLTPQEVDVLFTTLRRLRDEGTSILYISHKLEEIKALCERATILRGGKVVGTCIPAKETAKSMAEMMVGAKLKTPKKSKTKFGADLLTVTNMSKKSLDPFGTSLKLSGETPVDDNAIELEGTTIGASGPTQRRLRGLLTAPEERLGHAAAPDMSLIENTLISGFHRQQLGRKGFVNQEGATAFAQKVVNEFDVRTPTVSNAAKSPHGASMPPPRHPFAKPCWNLHRVARLFW